MQTVTIPKKEYEYLKRVEEQFTHSKNAKQVLSDLKNGDYAVY